MRPAREGRENRRGRGEVGVGEVASMRPAREGRENGRVVGREEPAHHASMRPAREGRENYRGRRITVTRQGELQ